MLRKSKNGAVSVAPLEGEVITSEEFERSGIGFFGKVGAAVGLMAASAMSFAVDHSAAISAAASDGTSNLTAAVTAVIGIVAVVVGAGLIIGFLKKS